MAGYRCGGCGQRWRTRRRSWEKVKKVHRGQLEKWDFLQLTAASTDGEKMKAGRVMDGQTSKPANQRKISTGMEEKLRWNIYAEEK